DKLNALYRPKKKIYAKISFIDINRLSPGDRENNNKSLTHLKLMDALAIVINGFTPGQDSKAMAADFNFCLSELILSDLDQVVRKLERLGKPQKPNTLAGRPEKEVFEQLNAVLENNAFLSTLDLPADLWKELNSYSFLTLKPMFVVVNLSEEKGAADPPGMAELHTEASARGLPVVRIYAKLEKDLQELPAPEREVFIQEYRLPLDGKSAFIRQAYATAGLVSFLTVGEDEVRAWTVKQGTSVREAAGVIHKDLMNYFVRAEVIHYDKLLECGSEHEAVKRGWMRSEKKEYPVADGDVLHILASK
ncbi:redox-regulated ATPase YchF, partial [candidate division FCPU426 bacterium]|nr:redox-regulated ATPase YchF [candidate division FCPU426 bacterium]